MQVGGFAVAHLVDTIVSAAHYMQIKRKVNRGTNNSVYFKSFF